MLAPASRALRCARLQPPTLPIHRNRTPLPRSPSPQYEGFTSSGQRHLRLGAGWRYLCRANNAAVGDTLALERWTPDRSVIHLRILKPSQGALPQLPAGLPAGLPSLPVAHSSEGGGPLQVSQLPPQLQAMLGVAEAAAATMLPLPLPPLPLPPQEPAAAEAPAAAADPPAAAAPAAGASGLSAGTVSALLAAGTAAQAACGTEPAPASQAGTSAPAAAAQHAPLGEAALEPPSGV